MAVQFAAFAYTSRSCQSAATFRDCKALLVTSLTHEGFFFGTSSAVANIQTFISDLAFVIGCTWYDCRLLSSVTQPENNFPEGEGASVGVEKAKAKNESLMMSMVENGVGTWDVHQSISLLVSSRLAVRESVRSQNGFGS